MEAGSSWLQVEQEFLIDCVIMDGVGSNKSATEQTNRSGSSRFILETDRSFGR